MKYFIALLLTLAVCTPAHAERFAHVARKANQKPAKANTLTCKKIVDVGTLRNLLYKNSNLHGGRGRSFLDQDHQLGGVRTLKVAGTNGKIFSCFGLWACDHPYGCRYYQAMCGDSLSNASFAAKARQNGGSNFALVGNGNGKTCFKINAASARYGSVRK